MRTPLLVRHVRDLMCFSPLPRDAIWGFEHNWLSDPRVIVTPLHTMSITICRAPWTAIHMGSLDWYLWSFFVPSPLIPWATLWVDFPPKSAHVAAAYIVTRTNGV